VVLHRPPLQRLVLLAQQRQLVREQEQQPALELLALLAQQLRLAQPVPLSQGQKH
jgi:hypothetical protein